MKKMLTFAVLFALSAALHAQKDVTRFLGIPVDGSKPEMIQKLKEKGFAASPDGEDISYQMIVNNKRYQASFYQTSEPTDSLAARDLRLFLVNKFGEEIADNPVPSEELQEKVAKAIPEFLTEKALNKNVWFMILQFYGEYHITIYYDNKYNEAHGEDL